MQHYITMYRGQPLSSIFNILSRHVDYRRAYEFIITSYGTDQEILDYIAELKDKIDNDHFASQFSKALQETLVKRQNEIYKTNQGADTRVLMEEAALALNIDAIYWMLNNAQGSAEYRKYSLMLMDLELAVDSVNKMIPDEKETLTLNEAVDLAIESCNYHYYYHQS